MSVLSARIMCVPGAMDITRGWLEPLELVLQIVISHQLGVRNPMCPLEEQQVLLTIELVPQHKIVCP